MKPSYLTTLKVVAGIGMFAMIIVLANAYTAPTTTAPGGNVPAPINTGPTIQTKSGGTIGAGSLYTLGATMLDKGIGAKKISIGTTWSGMSNTSTEAADLDILNSGPVDGVQNNLLKLRYTGSGLAGLLDARTNTSTLAINSIAGTSDGFSNTQAVTLVAPNISVNQLKVANENLSLGSNNGVLISDNQGKGIVKWGITQPVQVLTTSVSTVTAPFGGTDGEIKAATAVCPGATIRISGGVTCDSMVASISTSAPTNNNGWIGGCKAPIGGSKNGTTFALCAIVASTTVIIR